MTTITRRFGHLLALVLAALAPACTVTDTQPPPLTGPSEMSLSLAITANPDVLPLDGSSQSTITIEARDANGQPAPNTVLRAEINVGGVTVDYGSLSTKHIQTGSNGRASVTYTAPPSVPGADSASSVAVDFIPAGTDAASAIARRVNIRLVLPGTIGILPTAQFSATPTNPAAFTDVRFDGSSSRGGLGATIVKYVWDFGDSTSTSGTSAITTHQYKVPGTYQATLTVTDSNGLSDKSDAQAIQVGTGQAPTASFVFSPTAPQINQTVFFNGTGSTAGPGHQIVRYEWDFGAGSRRSGADGTVSKSYDDPGTYNVILTVTDEVGQTAQTTKAVTVGGGAPTAQFTFSPTLPTVDQAVFFNGGGSSPGSASSITSYAWNFGDGSTGTGVTRSKTYTTAGTYVVRLTITNSDGETATITQNVPVSASPQPTAVLTISPPNPSVGQSVQFNGSSSTAPAGSTITSYVWDFGDGTPGATGATTSHTYGVAATYTIRLTVTDSTGRTATSTQPLTVN